MNVWDWLKEDRDFCMPYTVFALIIISIIGIAVIFLAVMLWSGITNFRADTTSDTYSISTSSQTSSPPSRTTKISVV